MNLRSLRNKSYRIFLIFLISYSLNVRAENTVLYIHKDTPAPFTGYLFSPDKAEQQRKITLERDSYKLLNESYEKSLGLQKDINLKLENQVTILSDSNSKLAKTAYDSQSMSTLERIGWFSLGVLATSFAVYGLRQVVK